MHSLQGILLKKKWPYVKANVLLLYLTISPYLAIHVLLKWGPIQ
jgi:hypothetical protein